MAWYGKYRCDKIGETAELNYHSRKSETSCLIPIQNNHLASSFAIINVREMETGPVVDLHTKSQD